MKLFTLRAFIIYLLVIIFNACKTETIIIEQDYSNPNIRTDAATILDKNSFQLNATIIKLNDVEVIEHGFAFQKKINDQQYGSEQKITIKGTVNLGTYSENYKPAIAPKYGDIYQYYYFLKTKNGLYKGEYVSITIDDITLPYAETQATVGENITINGDFSNINSTYLLLTEDNKQPVPYILNQTKNELTFQLSNIKNANHGNTLHFILKSSDEGLYSMNKRIASVKVLGTLKQTQPVIYNYADKLILYGDGLPQSTQTDFYVLINDHKIPYRTEIKFSEIENFKDQSFTLGYSNGRDKVVFPEVHTFVLPTPSQIVFDRKVLHPYTHFSVSGYEFEYFKKDNHFLGSYELQNFTKNFVTYTFQINDIPDGNYTYSYESEVNQVETLTTIEVRSLKVDKLDKSEFYAGERILLHGTFLKGERYLVGFNDSHLNQSFLCTKEGELNAENLSLSKGSKTMRVGYESYFPLNISIINLGYTLKDFSPKKGYRGQLMTIKGKGINHATSITFGSSTVEYNIQRSLDEIKFIVPNTVQNGKVKIGINLPNEYLEFTETFEVL